MTTVGGIKTINQLMYKQKFSIPNQEGIYEYQRQWLDDPGTWQYQYQNIDTKKIHITSDLINVYLVQAEFRIVVKWANGAYLNSLDDNFHVALNLLIDQFGKPEKIEIVC